MKKYFDVWMSAVIGPAPANGGRIAETGLTAEKIYDSRRDLSRYGVFTENQMAKAAATDITDVAKVYRAHLDNEIQSVNCFDDDYPERFRGLYNRPAVLFYKGDLSLLDSSYTVAVIGSRHHSGEGERACSLIAKSIAECGGVVVSGLAQGVDTIAHKACVAAGGRTVAFVGMPLDTCFPKSNYDFQKKLENEQLVISEYPCGYRYYSSNFIQRNRLIAAACDGLCVIQAKKRSGSLSTVNRALEYDKPVFTVPGSIFDEGYSGSNQLLVEGKAMAVTGGEQIMEYLGYKPAEKAKPKKKKLPPVSDMARQVLAVMDKPMFPSAVVKLSPLPAGITKAALTELEVAGYVVKTESGEYVAAYSV